MILGERQFHTIWVPAFAGMSGYSHSRFGQTPQ